MIDIKKAIEHFDLVSFLENNNINYKLEGKNIGTEWIGIETCVSCGASNFHAALHKTNKTFTCWVCKESMWLGKFIAEVKGCNKKEAIEILIENGSIVFKGDLKENGKLSFGETNDENGNKISFEEFKQKFQVFNGSFNLDDAYYKSFRK